LALIWDNITVGMKLEVENQDIEGYVLDEKTYWVASVMEIQGKEEMRVEINAKKNLLIYLLRISRLPCPASIRRI
jgi:hypothetical protein